MSYQDVQHHYLDHPAPCPHGDPGSCSACDVRRLEARAVLDEDEIVLLQSLLAGLYAAEAVPMNTVALTARTAAHAYLAARGLLP